MISNEPKGKDPTEQELLEVIDERDRAEQIADALATEIAVLLGVEIGEHSNFNCPWENALEAICGRNAT